MQVHSDNSLATFQNNSSQNKSDQNKPGQIRVGRCVYQNNQRIDPTYSGYEQILVLTKSSKYGSLGPYCLKNEKGQIMENIWQFSKVYQTVPKSVQRYSKYDRTVIWDHPAETHATINPDSNYTLTGEYLKWRNKGINCPYPVRYPVGFNHRHKCLFALQSVNGKIDPTPLDYIQSRINIYVPVYIELVKKEPQFLFLLNKIRTGQNILIIEVDGPHQESLSYYKDKYTANNNFIEGGTMLCTKENLNIMLYDDKHPFGHGYCLAIALTMEL